MSEGRGEKKGQGTISYTTLFYTSSEVATASATTYSMENSRASVTKLAQPIGDAIAVAGTEYAAGADILWRYKISDEMLRKAPIERRSREHIQYVEQ